MARAKRTARAEARRRYRNEQGLADADDAPTEAGGGRSPAPPRRLPALRRPTDGEASARPSARRSDRSTCAATCGPCRS